GERSALPRAGEGLVRERDAAEEFLTESILVMSAPEALHERAACFVVAERRPLVLVLRRAEEHEVGTLAPVLDLLHLRLALVEQREAGIDGVERTRAFVVQRVVDLAEGADEAGVEFLRIDRLDLRRQAEEDLQLFARPELVLRRAVRHGGEEVERGEGLRSLRIGQGGGVGQRVLQHLHRRVVLLLTHELPGLTDRRVGIDRGEEGEQRERGEHQRTVPASASTRLTITSRCSTWSP